VRCTSGGQICFSQQFKPGGRPVCETTDLVMINVSSVDLKKAILSF
jgi:hypothetical protein